MAFKQVGKVSEIEKGTAVLYNLDDREIAVFNVDGKLYALDDYCSHEEGSLSEGYLKGCEVECPIHGARFNVKTGEVTEEPAVLPVDSFPVRIVDDNIEIDV